MPSADAPPPRASHALAPTTVVAALAFTAVLVSHGRSMRSTGVQRRALRWAALLFLLLAIAAALWSFLGKQ